MFFFSFIILVVSLGLLAWAWVGFPLLLAVWPKGAGSQTPKAPPLEPVGLDRTTAEPAVSNKPHDKTTDQGPRTTDQQTTDNGQRTTDVTISIIIAAYNEEEVIKSRLNNLAEVDLPEGTEILIGCDGCDDQTAKLVEAWGNNHEKEKRSWPQKDTKVTKEKQPTTHDSQLTTHFLLDGCSLQLFDFPQRRGKPSVLKDLMAASSGDILVFSDANTMFEAGAIEKLLCPFSDETIGGVCGRLVFVDDGAATKENIYWKLETWLKTKESQIDSCLGANGAIYAIRRELFWRGMPSTTIVDDFVIGMKVRELGQRVIYAPEAIATEAMPKQVGDEWHRRARIGAGGYQAIGLCKACLSPSFGFFSLAFWSHKILRWFTPHLMLLVLVTTIISLCLATTSWLSIALWLLLAMQLAWYALALIGAWEKAEKAEEEEEDSQDDREDRDESQREKESEKYLSKQDNSASGTATLPPPHFSLSASSSRPGLPDRPVDFFFRVFRLFRGCSHAIYYFCAMQLALLMGFIRFLRGVRTGTWRRTAR